MVLKGLKSYQYYHGYIAKVNAKTYITTAEFNGLSSAAYGNGIVHSERKILAKI